MLRKLVKQGAATLMVSLPAKWARQFGLGKGSEVNVSEEDSALIITAGKAKGKKVKELDIKKGEFMRRLLYIPYREGYDEIRIRFEDPKAMKEIEATVDMIMGFEILDQKPNQCRIGSVSTETEQSFENVLRRCFLLIKSMANESYDALSRKEFEKMRPIGDMERSVHRYCDFTMRIINKAWMKPKPEITRAYWIITIIKEISDLLADSCNYMHDKKPAVSRQFLELYRKTVGLISRLGDEYYKPSIHSLVQFRKSNISIVESGKKILSGKESRLMHNLLGIAERVRRAQELLV